MHITVVHFDVQQALVGIYDFLEGDRLIAVEDERRGAVICVEEVAILLFREYGPGIYAGEYAPCEVAAQGNEVDFDFIAGD